jgi:regulation of enolase protein 1 (concanavalin A-like superfamily)
MADANADFSDEFDSSALDSRWTFIDPDGGSTFNLTSNPGWLRISTVSPPDRDLVSFIDLTNAPRIMTSGITGDFSIETKISAVTTVKDQGAGILIWKDANHFIILGRMARSDGSLPVEQQIFFSTNGDPWTYESLSSNLNPTYLRLERIGNLFRAFYSSDGNVWTALMDLYLTINDPVDVGIYVTNVYNKNPFYADFDYVRLTSTNPQPTSSPTPISKSTIELINARWKHIGPQISDLYSGEASQPTLPKGIEVYDLAHTYVDGVDFLYAAVGNWGLYRWSELAQMWMHLDNDLSINSHFCRSVAVDPTSPDTIYAGYGGAGKLARSTNGGKSWAIYDLPPSPEGAVAPGREVIEIVIDPKNPNVLYIGTQNGVAKSVDSGQSSTMLDKGIPTKDFIVWSIAINPTNSNVVFLGGEDQSDISHHIARIFKSTNGGKTWTELGDPVAHPMDIAINPESGTVLVASEGVGILKPVDGGETWQRISQDSGLSSTNVCGGLAIDPKNPSIVYAGTNTYTGGNGGVYFSTDEGETWKELNAGLSARQVGSLVIDAYGQVLYAACGVYDQNEPDLNLRYEGKGVYRLLSPSKIHDRYDFKVSQENNTFPVYVITNSMISNFGFNQSERTLSFTASGTATSGFSSVTIPRELLDGPYEVTVDDVHPQLIKEIASTDTHKTVYFTYSHSAHNIKIVGAKTASSPPNELTPTPTTSPASGGTASNLPTESILLIATIIIFAVIAIVALALRKRAK